MGSGGLQWDAGDTLSSSRLNQKGLFIGTGAQIAALTPLTGMHAFCTSTGSGFTSGVEYRYNGSAWKAISVQLDDSHQLNAQAEMRFADADSSNYVGFKAPDPIAANKVWVLPNADGAAGQVLKTDGSLNLGWVDAITNPLNNNINFQQKNSGATNRTLIYRNSSNMILIGDTAQNTGVTINEPLNMIAGTALFHSNDTLRTHTGDTSTVKIKESTIYMPGTYTIKFDAKFDAAGGGNGNARVYKNGVALGTNRSLTTGFVTYSEDLGTFAIGDLVQVFGGNTAAASTVSVQNFRLYGAWAPQAAATTGF